MWTFWVIYLPPQAVSKRILFLIKKEMPITSGVLVVGLTKGKPSLRGPLTQKTKQKSFFAFLILPTQPMRLFLPPEMLSRNQWYNKVRSAGRNVGRHTMVKWRSLTQCCHWCLTVCTASLSVMCRRGCFHSGCRRPSSRLHDSGCPPSPDIPVSSQM